MKSSLLKQKPAIGTAFYHSEIQERDLLQRISGCKLGTKSPDTLQPPELEERPTPIYFDSRGDGLFRSGNVKDYVFFELSPIHYKNLEVPGNIYWMICRDEVLLRNFITRMKELYPSKSATFYGVLLGKLLKNLVWNEDLSEDDKERAYLRTIHATLEGQRGISNVTDIELATGFETGILRAGVVALISNELRLKARELHLRCCLGGIRSDVVIDGGGRFRVGAYRNLQHILPFVRLISIVAAGGMLTEVDEPAEWKEFYIEFEEE